MHIMLMHFIEVDGKNCISLFQKEQNLQGQVN